MDAMETLKVRSWPELSIDDRCHPLQPSPPAPIDDPADLPAAISPKSDEISKGTRTVVLVASPSPVLL